jgi:hypothetical protein
MLIQILNELRQQKPYAMAYIVDYSRGAIYSRKYQIDKLSSGKHVCELLFGVNAIS